MEAAYPLTDLVIDCGIGISKAYISKGAMQNAQSDFNLNTQEEVLSFIGNGGLESPCLTNSKQWENNPNPDNPIMVDSYDFYSGSIYGYMAFFYQPVTRKWVIKSFKKNIGSDTRNPTFREALSKLKNQR